MKKFFKDMLNSLNSEPGGYSARKLSALFAVMLSGYITYLHSVDSNVVELTIVWLSFALLCLGLVTFGQLVELRTGTITKNITKTIDTKEKQETTVEPK